MSKKDKARRKRALDRRAKGELKKQLLSYSIAAGAALVCASHAGAGVIYSGPQDIVVNSGNPSVGVDLDGGGPEVSIGLQGGSWSNTNTWTSGGSAGYYNHTTASSYAWTTTSSWQTTYTSSSGGRGNSLRVSPNVRAAVATTAGSTHAANFSKSQFVGPSGADGTAYWAGGVRLLAGVSNLWWQTGYGGSWSSTWSYGNFVGAKGFIGVRFDNGAGLKYGWIEFEGADDASWGRITGWAYETSGSQIHAGDQGSERIVPEPGGLALLATGAAGLAALRKKRHAA